MEMNPQEIINIIQAYQDGKTIELDPNMRNEDWREIASLDTILNMISEGWIARIKNKKIGE